MIIREDDLLDSLLKNIWVVILFHQSVSKSNFTLAMATYKIYFYRPEGTLISLIYEGIRH